MNWRIGTGLIGTYAVVLGWAGLIALAVWWITHATRTEHPVRTSEPARAILDDRFDSGEISAEEYARMRRAMSQGRNLEGT